MAQALKAILAGMRYQSWLFWGHAVQLMREDSNVVEVRFEDSDVQSFDDIVVLRDPPLVTPSSAKVVADHIQAKYHMGSGGAFTIDALTNPAFIGATSRSLLARLGDAFRLLGADEYQRRRFWIVSPWSLDPGDRQLRELWRDPTSKLRLDVLRQGSSPTSQWVNLRAKWRETSGMDHEDALYVLLDQLRIRPSQGDLNGGFAEHVSAKLHAVGLKGIQPERAVEPYSQIPWALYEQDVTVYTKARIRELADAYDLWGTGPVKVTPGRRLGIRTAVRWGDQMESTTEVFLPLEEYFDGRFIRDDASWPARYADVHSFLRARVNGGGPVHLDVGGVCTIAFAAGYALPVKDGIQAYPIQRSRAGEEVWTASVPDTSQGGWTIVRDEPVGSGADVAIGLALTHPVWADMEQFVRMHLPFVGRVIEIRSETGVGHQSVVGAGHALHLAGEMVSVIRNARTAGATTVHLFIAAPNAFTFILGQEAERLGRCQLYEFDLGKERTGLYQPSLLVPDHTR